MVNNDISNHLRIICMHAVDKFNQFTLGSPSRVLVTVLRLVITRTSFRFTRRWKPYHIEIQTYIRTILQQCGPLGITNLSRSTSIRIFISHITRSFIVVRIVVERLQHYVRTTLRNRSRVTWSLRWNIRFLVAHDLHADLAVEGDGDVRFLIHFEEHVSVGIARDTVCAASEIQRLSTPVRSPCSIRDFESIFASRKIVVGNGIILQFASILAPVFAAAPSRTGRSITSDVVCFGRIKWIWAAVARTNIYQISDFATQFDIEVIFACHRASQLTCTFTTREVLIRSVRIKINHPSSITAAVNQFNLIANSQINTTSFVLSTSLCIRFSI